MPVSMVTAQDKDGDRRGLRKLQEDISESNSSGSEICFVDTQIQLHSTLFAEHNFLLIVTGLLAPVKIYCSR